MNVAVLIATAWFAISVGFLAGLWWAARSLVPTYDDLANIKQANRVLGAAFMAQRDYIDYLEGGGDVVAEAENLLREPGT